MNPRIKYGVLSGAGICLFILIEFLLGLHTTRLDIGQYTGFVSILIPVYFIYRCIKEVKESEHNGELPFWAGFRAGVVSSIIAAIIITVFMLIYVSSINTHWVDIGAEFERVQLQKEGRNQTYIDAAIQETRELYTPKVLAPAAFTGIAFQGALISAVVSIVLRRRSAPPKKGRRRKLR